jgi:hypothetical protein
MKLNEPDVWGGWNKISAELADNLTGSLSKLMTFLDKK